MTLRDRLRNQYDRYLDRCELEDTDQAEILTFDGYVKAYYSYLEDEGGY